MVSWFRHIFRDLGPVGDLHFQPGHTKTVYYNEVALGRWLERTRFEDAVARTAWPIELHDRSDGYVWEMFGPDHVHYVPLRAMTPPGAHNLVAAGRCVDGDAAALSSVRVMGPCAAMGAGAAHALDLAGRGSVHDVDLDRLRDRLIANISG
jgi:FAD dependent oxidoreductase